MKKLLNNQLDYRNDAMLQVSSSRRSSARSARSSRFCAPASAASCLFCVSLVFCQVLARAGPFRNSWATLRAILSARGAALFFRRAAVGEYFFGDYGISLLPHHLRSKTVRNQLSGENRE